MDNQSNEAATALINMKNMAQQQSQKIISQDAKGLDDIKSPPQVKASDQKTFKKLSQKKHESIAEVNSPTHSNQASYAQDGRSNAGMSIAGAKSKVSKADLVEREIQMQVLLRK